MLADGRRVFVKAAVDEMTDGWLRAEERIYSQVEGGFLPRFVAFVPENPSMLVLEDLSTAHWPPPWRVGDVDAVRASLASIASTPPPAGVPSIVEDRGWLDLGWEEVERDPAPFLSLRLSSRAWLEAALPTLRTAAESAPIEGDAFLHLDVRSDNLCVQRDRAILVDWNLCRIGNPLVDLAFWLPSLHAEGGPAPEEVLPDGAAELAALVAGFFAVRAGLPPAPTAPRVRTVQLSQLRVALPWAATGLGLDSPG